MHFAVSNSPISLTNVAADGRGQVVRLSKMKVESPAAELRRSTAENMRYTRAVILSGIYFATLALLWLTVGNWAAEVIKASAQTETAGSAAVNGAGAFTNFGRAIVYPSALGFIVSALWLSSKRNFTPIARYAVPSALAGALTIPLCFVVLYIFEWIWYYLWPVPRFLTLVLLSIVAIVPGFVTGQLLRFPRVKVGETPIQRAPLSNEGYS
jgi:hypothetical protein